MVRLPGGAAVVGRRVAGRSDRHLPVVRRAGRDRRVSESLSWTGFAYPDKPWAYQADGLPSRQPVSSPVSTARQGRDKPYGILYVKGASVIRSLAALIGDGPLTQG